MIITDSIEARPEVADCPKIEQVPIAGSGKSTKLSLSESFCEYWANVEYADIPQSVVLLAKRHLLDTIAASIAGADAATTQYWGAETFLEWHNSRGA